MSIYGGKGLTSKCFFCWVALEFNAILTTKVRSWWPVTTLLVTLLSHISTETTFLYETNHWRFFSYASTSKRIE